MSSSEKKEKKSKKSSSSSSSSSEKKEKKSKKSSSSSSSSSSSHHHDKKEKKSKSSHSHRKEKLSEFEDPSQVPAGLRIPERRDRAAVEDEINVLYKGDGQDGRRVCQDDFELISVIGRGSFGKVMQVKKIDSGKIYAMKVLKKEAVIARKQVEHTRAEKTILTKVHHPFIIGLHWSFQTEDKLYMILDFVNGGELFYHLKQEGRFSEERVRFYGAEIALALGHMHKYGVAYRDLKPENILLDSDGHIRITDFGLSKEITEPNSAQTFCGTPEYLAPEVLKGQGHGVAVDWWSLGTLVYEMIAGLPPFYSQNVNVMYQKILSSELRFPTHFSAEACSFLEGVLTREPDKRLGGGPNDIEDIKRHPWFRDLDWGMLEKRELVPPFIPPVEGEHDLSQIDPAFTEERPQHSLVDDTLEQEMAGQFEGFTYVNESEIAD